MTCVNAYYHLAYRVRGWGALPRRRGATLVVANHQHELEAAALVAALSVRPFSWRYPIFAVAGRRMFEPGFLADRLPLLRFALREVNSGTLLGALGLQPVENELHTRSFGSLAYWARIRHGDVPVDAVFSERARARLPSDIKTVADILDARHFKVSRTPASLSELLEPYRSEELAATRKQLEADVEHFAQLARDGATIYITPEGTYSGDGRMRRMRGLLLTLGPLASIWMTAISYDPFVGRRLSMLYRVVQARNDMPLEPQVKANRPITTSVLLGNWLHGRREPFAPAEAEDAVIGQVATLPPNVFIDPELRRMPQRMVRSALDGLRRTGTLEAAADRLRLTERRSHPQFPRTADIIEYQHNFLQESLEGAAFMSSAAR
ncbi:MAG: hypothetical protein JO219_13430 [Candidatus Eremiobacteraeota bacterium]|nr:hypothetical protein [Candidatus Eremiobacteraeota bacterium]